MKILLQKLIQFRFLFNVKHFSVSLVLTILFSSLQISAWADEGDLDTSFSGDGKVTTAIGSSDDYIHSILVQSDGKIVAAGESWNGSDNDFALARYNTDGSLDTSFSGDGMVTTNISSNDGAYSVALQSDGKIVAAGYSNNGTNFDFALVRYNTDGSLDTSFSGDGKVTTAVGSSDDIINSIQIQSDGKIVAAGYSYNGPNSDSALARYNTDGSLDTSFSGDGKVTTSVGSENDTIESIVLQTDGKIVTAGFSDDGPNEDFALARYNTDGSLDTSFDTDGKVTTDILSNEVAYSVALQSDGKIVAAGYSDNGTKGYFALVRYNTNGTLDTTFDTDGKVTAAVGSIDDGIESVLVQSDGKIVAVGYSDRGTYYEMAVARFDSTGSLDSTFSGDGIQTTDVGPGHDEAWAAVLQSDGKILAAGPTNNGTDEDFALVRYLSSSSSGGGGSGGGGSGGDNPVALDFPWVGDQSISCPEANPWINEKLDFAKNVKPVNADAENSVGRTITHDSFETLKSSGVFFDTDSKKVNTATETLPDFGCKDRLLSGKVNQPIQFIAGGYTLQSDAHGYINTADQIWHDLNEVTLITNTAAFMQTIKFTKTGKYMVVLTEQPDTSAGISPTYGARSIRFVININ
jgi:uncharacterized delta-60 repeat protein